MQLPHGLLIAIEGIDGAGKTTQARRIAAALRAAGLQVLITKEPTNGEWGKLLRASAATGRLDPARELDLFMRDRAEHVELELRPALEAGKVVLVDRYYPSNAAYQGARGLESPQSILVRNQQAFLVPAAVLLLKVRPETGRRRILDRGDTPNEFEGAEALALVAAAFDELQADYIVRIDGEQPTEDVTAECLRHLADGPLFEALCRKHGLPRCEPEWCSYRIQGSCDYPGPAAMLGRQRGQHNELLEELARPDLAIQEKLALIGEALG